MQLRNFAINKLNFKSANLPKRAGNTEINFDYQHSVSQTTSSKNYKFKPMSQPEREFGDRVREKADQVYLDWWNGGRKGPPPWGV